MKRTLVAAALALLSGCARETMLIPAGSYGDYAAAGSAVARPHRSARTRGSASLRIPSGQACLDALGERGVHFRALPPKPGMQTPVRVEGPVGGVRFSSAGTAAIVCDCRLAMALDWVAPDLRALGVTEIRHSGAYVFRTQRNGKPSLHARGLAIDVHDVAVGSQRLTVQADYRRGLSHACTPSGSPINQITCRLSQSGLFQELITPDDNRDHHDHLHLAIAPL
jgi:hypothetical protein